jgi:hypothetical protein
MISKGKKRFHLEILDKFNRFCRDEESGIYCFLVPLLHTVYCKDICFKVNSWSTDYALVVVKSISWSNVI